MGLVFNEDFEARACDTCGELYLKAQGSRLFGAVLERLRAERNRKTVAE